MQGRTHKLKSARLVARRRKALLGKTVFLCIILVTIWEFVFWFTGLSYFAISEIKVKGVSSISESDIVNIVTKKLIGKYYFTIPRENIFFYPKDQILKELRENFSGVETVAMKFVNLKTVQIDVQERSTSGFWCQVQNLQELCHSIDSTGYIFDSPKENIANSQAFIKFYSNTQKSDPIGSHYVEPVYFKKLKDFLSNLIPIGLETVYIKEKDDFVFEIGLKEGQRIIIGSKTDLVSAPFNLESIIADRNFGSTTFAKVDYIDLRFGSKIFYKLK